jgi:adenine-specific DNA-methyltransferase
LSKVFCNKKQLEDWAELYKLDLEQLARDIESLVDKDIYKGLLSDQKYRFLMLDTKNFDEDFKEALLAAMQELDEEINGLLVNSENYQAANFLSKKYRGKAGLIYLDPPYNTDATPILYKNGYKDSTWASLMQDRIKKAMEFAGSKGVLCFAIDDTEVSLLNQLIDQAGDDRETFQCIVEHYPGSGTGRSNVTRTHEYCLFSLPQGTDLLRGDRLEDGERVRGFRRAGTGDNNYRIGDPGRPESFYAVIVDKSSFKVIGAEPPPEIGANYPLSDTDEGFARVYPIGEDGSERVWTLSFEAGLQAIKEGRILSSNNFAIKRTYTDLERRLLLPSIWQGGQYNATTGGTNLLTSIFGSSGKFSYPKAVGTMSRIVDAVAFDNERPLIVDLFAGSGTTAHAVIEKNRTEKTRYSYILVEMGDHSETIALKRIQKVCYSSIWKNGVPTDLLSGSSHMLKRISLESYEDSLSNLIVNSGPQQKAFRDSPEQSSLGESRQAYLMQYMLDVETRDSPSLLNTNLFLDPTGYQLDVRVANGDVTKPTDIDLLETFNYLLGLRVEHIAAGIHFEATFEQGEFGRWQASVKRSDVGRWWFRTVYGTNPNGQKVLVVWRNLPAIMDKEENGILYDNAVLDAVLIEKLNIRLTSSQDDEIDIMYVNGDNNISIPRDRQGQPMEQARLQLIEEAFHQLMFADTDCVH